MVGDARALARFRHEAKSAARLHHTNIVPVFEVGQDGDVAFYAMQFIQGQGLDQVIDELERWRDPARGAEGRMATEAAPETGTAGLALVKAAGSLLSGRLGTEDAIPPPGDTSDPFELDVTEGPSSGEGRMYAGAEGFGRGAADGRSASAVLPGGAAVSMIETSGRRIAYFLGVAQIGRQVAGGLAYAHARGIVHRDIKPSNLLLDTAGVVWITDFGLAKAEQDGLTATGDILGTIRYMAPERFRGEGDARADLYALGLTLYELLTLRPAFVMSDRLGLIDQIKTQDPPRPRSLDGSIPRDLETIVLKASDKDPARRYATAEAMAEDLGRFLDDQPIRARRASALERSARWARHHPGVALFIAALAVLLVVITLASLVVADRMARLARAEQASRAAAQAETYRALFSEVKALRAAHQPGWRAKALDLLARLASMRVPLRDPAELRTEAAATLGTPDIRLVDTIGLQPSLRGSFTFSPDGGTLITADPRTGLDFRDVPGKRPLSSAKGLLICEGMIPHDRVVYLADGRGLAVATDQGVVFADPRGVRAARAPITQGSSRPAKLAIAVGGRRIVVAWSGGAGITVHDLASGDLVDRWKDAIANPNFVVSLDGKWLARQEKADLVVQPIASAGPRVVLESHGGATALALSPDGALVAAASDESFASASDHIVVLWDVARRERIGVLRGHRGRITDVTFSPDGDWIATGGFDYTTRIWETRTGQTVAILHESTIPVYGVKWSPNGDHLAVSNSQAIFLFGIAGRHGVQQWLTGQRIEQSRVVAHPRRERIATSGFSELNSWDLSVSRPSPVQMEPNTGWVTALAYSPDGSLLATSSWRGTDHREILIRDADTGHVRGRISWPQIIDALAFDPAGGRIAFGDKAGNVVLWDLAASRPVRQFNTGSEVRSMAFLERPRSLVTHGKDAVLRFNLESGELERKVGLAGGTIRSLAADPARGRAVVGFQDGSIGGVALPDLTPGRRLEHAHDGGVEGLALSPDGRLLATIGADRRVVLRDAMTFEALVRFPLQGGRPMNLTFDASGRRLAVVGTGEDVELWDLAALNAGLTDLGLAWDLTAPADARPGGTVGEGDPAAVSEAPR